MGDSEGHWGLDVPTHPRAQSQAPCLHAQAFLEQGCHVIVTGRVCDPGERGERLRQVLRAACPLDRLLVASDAPHTTPQV